MTNGTDRPAKALEAARDVVKQLVTVDAALLTFGITFLQNVAKSQGPTGWIDAAAFALIVSLLFGALTLIAIVEQTHKATGSINAGGVRIALSVSLLGFALGALFLALFVILAPTPLPAK